MLGGVGAVGAVAVAVGSDAVTVAGSSNAGAVLAGVTLAGTRPEATVVRFIAGAGTMVGAVAVAFDAILVEGA